MKKKQITYLQKAQIMVKLLGGKENIQVARHCVSRIRLVVKNFKIIQDQAIDNLPFTRGTLKLTGNQYHIIIGPDVPELFQEFQKITKLSTTNAKQYRLESAQKQSFLRRMMNHFSEIFIPIIPVLVAAGLVLGLRNILEADFGGYKIIDHSAFMHGVYDFLWLPAEAGLWFLPVYIVWSIFQKMGASSVLGIFIGLTMLINPLLNVYEVSGNGLKWIWELDLKKFGFNFGAFQFPWKISYTAQVVPAILVGFSGVYLERGLTKIVTPVLRQIIVPLGTVLGAYILGMAIIGPLGWIVGTAISFAVKWALTNEIARYFFGPLFGLFYAPLVITGMHHMLNAVMIQNAATIGGTIFFPILAVSNIAQGAATLAYVLKHKQNQKLKQVGTAAVVSAWLGVTEPAMYGINTKYLSPFFAGMIGSAIGSLLIVVSGTAAAGIGNGAWLGGLSIEAQSGISGYQTWAGTGYTWFLLAGGAATIVAISAVWALPRIVSPLQKAEITAWKPTSN